MEKTFAIIKPDGVERNLSGKILERVESQGFKIVAMKRTRLSKVQAENFYDVHKSQPFFDSMTRSMSSGPVVLLVFEKENAIADWRKLMGATNPADAEAGTIRKDFAESIERNSVHGSDSTATAVFEISYFFAQSEILS